MKKIRIILDKNTCINCGSCEAEAPDFFKMSDDGELKLLNGSMNENNQYVLEAEVDEDQYMKLMSAKEMCPTMSIKIEEI